MKLNNAQAMQLAQALRGAARPGVEVVVCPSFVSLHSVGQIVRSHQISLGAQDMFWEDNGAFTGEISPEQLLDAGCTYVILGHSERRQNLGETYAQINRKLHCALRHGLTPVICVGETLEQRQNHEHERILMEQLQTALGGIELHEGQQCIIAYEPIWAIGTGMPIEPDQVQYVQQLLRHTLLDLVPIGVANNQIRFIYGGSVDSKNVTRFTNLQGITGVLPGTASLKAEEFRGIIAALAK